MPWARMRFRDNVVFVNVDEAGRPVLDGEGRAEMKYRENDEKVYRPSPRNLEPAGDAPASEARQPAAKRARAGGKSTSKASKPSKPRGPWPDSELAVWTDGACTGNPGPMGIGMVVIGPEKRIERGEYLGMGTNNIAELVAIERGLDLAATLAPGVLGPEAKVGVRIHTDSGYSIGVLSLGWKAKANQELIERLRGRLREFPFVAFEKVAGHAGIPDNERCDELAREAIKRRATV